MAEPEPEPKYAHRPNIYSLQGHAVPGVGIDLALDAVDRIATTWWLLGSLAIQPMCNHLLKRNIQNMINR